MSKRLKAHRAKRVKIPAPPIFTPTVIRVPAEDLVITDAQFSTLEVAGEVRLTGEQRKKLLTLAIFWIGDLQIRRSPRPKTFWKILREMEDAFLRAEAVCRSDGQFERHLIHWAMEAGIKNAADFPGALLAFEQQAKTLREMIASLKARLPPDPGRQRPFDDQRRMISLAEIFEDAGGRPVIYADAYHQTGSTKDTPFRRFAQVFYSFLPAEDKRAPGGLDEALRDALAARRAQRRILVI